MRIFKWLFPVFFIGWLLYSCVYHRITHMNEDEMGWVANRHEGEIMYFQSPNGAIDTIEVWEITIHNSLNPINWGYFNTSNKEHIATADVRYSVNSNDGGIFHIKKQFKDSPVCFSSVLIDGWLYDVPLNTTCLRVDGITLNDIMVFDNRNSESLNRNDANSIMSYAWSKKYGLVQYTFQDGTVFSRMGINREK